MYSIFKCFTSAALFFHRKASIFPLLEPDTINHVGGHTCGGPLPVAALSNGDPAGL